MSKWSITIDVDDEKVKNISGRDNLEDAVLCELGWCAESGIFVEEMHVISEHNVNK